MNDLDPLPLDDVLSIVDRRARRRQRLAVGGTLGAGAVVAVVVGVSVSDTGPPTTAVVADDGGRTSAAPTAPDDLTTTTASAPVDGRPGWHYDAAAYALETVGFTYDDAEDLAAQWQVDTFTTKVVVGEAARNGLLTAPDALIDGSTDTAAAAAIRDEFLDAFWSSDYEVSDAEQLGAQWAAPLYDSKLLIGVRLAGDQPVEG